MSQTWYQMSDFFFFLPPLPFLFFLVIHSSQSRKKIIKGIERKNSNKVQSDNCSALGSVLDWTAEVRLLVLRVVIWSVLQYHAVEQGLKNTHPPLSLGETLMPKQVSGLWFHGFLGLSHVTFSG